MMPSVATSEPSTALIAGAGIGGLAAGVALRRAGWNVRIYERTARPRELGFGLLLAPNALAALHAISLRSRDASGASPAEVLESRLPGFDRPFRDIVSSTTVEDMRLDELFRRGPLDAWGAGPVTLLGDAAHPVMPQTGQGAAQALEDAVALGLALRHGSAEDGLRRYERVRSRRTRRFVKLGPRLARLTTTTNPAIIALRTAALRMLPSAALAQPMRALRRDPHGELRGG
jgi:2-polyprenyl-6-methoxyphenol hydroxylase-like FAD-dependent oxidoreductase